MAAAAAHSQIDPAQARAEGFAEARRALAGNEVAPNSHAAQVAIPAPTRVPSNLVSTVTPNDGQHTLSLTCVGSGVADKQRGSFIGNGWGWAVITSHHDRQFNDQVDIRLFAGDDRIRLPRTMLPGLHGGQDGWFKLKDVVADARSIRAHAAVAAFHNPQVYIDRMTGTVSISGKSGDYSGECRAVQADAPAQF